MFNKLKIISFKLSIIIINIRLARLVKLARCLNNNSNFVNNLRSQISEKELHKKISQQRKLNKQLIKLQNSLFDLEPDHWDQL